MTHFYFHLIESDGVVVSDMEGIDLPNELAAVAGAVHQLRSIVAHDVRETGAIRMDLTIRIMARNSEIHRDVNVAQAIRML